MAAVATPSAAARTLAVPELLENILLFANPIQLFALQRVNTTFRDVISGSISIQQRMLLDPDHVPDFERAKEVLQDLRIQRVMHLFEVASVDFNDECLELELYIEDDFVNEIRNKTASSISWSSNDRKSADHQWSWSTINLIPQHEDCMEVQVFYKKFVGVARRVELRYLGVGLRFGGTTLQDILSGAVEVVAKAPRHRFAYGHFEQALMNYEDW